MKLDIFIIDAFSSHQFKGNSAAVVPVDHCLSDDLMQSIATENNLSETAFIECVGKNQYKIRWFSPLTEIDFCGHATLASAYVLFNEFGLTEEIEFITLKVGCLKVNLNSEGEIQMKFPNLKPDPVSVAPPELLAGLSKSPAEVLQNQQAYFAVFENEKDVVEVSYFSEQLKKLAPFDVVVTAAGVGKYDFISRYFWPVNGGGEDPVTGSIHAGLAPYWAEKLGRNDLLAYQASSRGGVLKCTVTDEHIVISGNGVLYLKGQINLE